MAAKRPQRPASSVARVLKPEERAAKRQDTANRRDKARQARATDRKGRGGVAEQEHLYSGRSPAQAARQRAARKASDDRKARTARTNGREEGLYGGQSEADKARGRAAGKAAQDRGNQAARVARGGLHSSAAAADRKSTKAKTVAREGLYDANSPANAARTRAGKRAAADRQNQAKRRVGSTEHKAEQQRKQREAQAKQQQAEARAKELEGKARAARARADKLKGKDRRAAKEDAERLEAEAKQARREAKDAGRDSAAQSPGEQEHLYNGQSNAARQREEAAQKVQARQDHLYAAVVADSPQSAPPVVERGAASMQASCTRQAWDGLETSIAMLA